MVLQGDELYRNAVIAGALGFITFGCDAGVLGGVLSYRSLQEAIKAPTTTVTSMITSIFLVASWFGCIIISLFGMRMGRRSWILLEEVIQIICTIICATSYSYGQLIAGRLFVGIGNGLCTSMILVYVAEMATVTSKRRAGVNMMICAAALGIALAYWVDLQDARRIRTGVILVGIGYMIGTDMVYYYMKTIFRTYLGLSSVTASALPAVATTVLTITNYLGVIFMEKLSRRTWLIAGAIAQTVFMACFNVFGPTWGPVPYVYASEFMPLRYRHIGFALSVSAQWISGFLTTSAGPIAIADPSVSWKTWIWFLVFNAIAGPYVYFCCPETRGRTLEEVNSIFMSERLQNTSAAKQLGHMKLSGTEDNFSVEEKGVPKVNAKPGSPSSRESRHAISFHSAKNQAYSARIHGGARLVYLSEIAATTDDV
ncbi:MFS general substrate transporter [Saccharata proteae CBS 121410]|uniref:MFS general substrate transporter n=1 Tax=Saccharata proteae CBS 121410 TaxID=1314787 RepID=A0A9P4HWC4_9PEZI|nr:MFS general substrate transporter [Saccharata proteae CBS 121410]